MYKKIFTASLLSVCVSQQALAMGDLYDQAKNWVKKNKKKTAIGALCLAALGLGIWAFTDGGYVFFTTTDPTLQGCAFHYGDGKYIIISNDGKEAFLPNQYRGGLLNEWYSLDADITKIDDPNLLESFNADKYKGDGFTYNGVQYDLMFVIGDYTPATTDDTTANNAEVTQNITQQNHVDDVAGRTEITYVWVDSCHHGNATPTNAGTTSSAIQQNSVDDAASGTETVNSIDSTEQTGEIVANDAGVTSNAPQQDTNVEHTVGTAVDQDGSSGVTVDEATTSTRTASTNDSTEQNAL